MYGPDDDDDFWSDDGDDFAVRNYEGAGDFAVVQGPVFGGAGGFAQTASQGVGFQPVGFDPAAARLEEIQTRRDGGAPAAMAPDAGVVSGSAVGTPEELAEAQRRSQAQDRAAAARAAGDYVAARYWTEQYDPERATVDYPDDGVRNAILSGRATGAPVEWLAAQWGPIVREMQARRDGDTAAARYWASQDDPARAQREYPDAVVRNYLARLPTSAPLDWVQTFLPPGVAPVGLLPGQTPAQWDAGRAAAMAEDQAERARRQTEARAASGGAGLSALPGALASLFTGAASQNPVSALLSQVLGGAQLEESARATAARVLGVTAPQLDAIRRMVGEQQYSLQATAEHRELVTDQQWRDMVVAQMLAIDTAVRQMQRALDQLGPARW